MSIPDDVVRDPAVDAAIDFAVAAFRADWEERAYGDGDLLACYEAWTSAINRVDEVVAVYRGGEDRCV